MRGWIGCLFLLGVSGCGANAPGSVQIVGGDYQDVAEARRHGLVGLVAARDGVRRGYCTGTLVARNAVLTAAHCRFTPRGEVRWAIFSDEIFARQDDFAEIVSVEPVGTADLAIAWLATEAPAGYEVAPLLERLTTAVPDGTPLTALGFGRQATSEPLSGGPLKRLLLRPSNLAPGVPMFVVRAAPGTGLCYGDSGGPVFLNAADGRGRLAGVLSNGTPECESGGDTFVSVPFHAAEIRRRLSRGRP